MSQHVERAASSPSRDEYFEESEYYDQRDADHSEESRTAKKEKPDWWAGIFAVTQFWVICFAVVVFLLMVYGSAYKLYDRETLETKDRVSQSHSWFKLAVCLRPFMTSGLMKQAYDIHMNRSLESHVDSLDIPDEQKALYKRPFYFDSTLDPDIYQYYFSHIHPWKEISPSVLWEFQKFSIRTAFEEFRVNGVTTGKIQKERLSERSSNKNGASLQRYVTLPSPTAGNLSEGKTLLFGEYFLSPMYFGCLSMTVNQEMGEKQMEISIKFRPRKTVLLPKNEVVNKTISTKTITVFEAADLFVFNKNDTFTEIPTVKRLSMYSLTATARERLMVKNSRYIRQKSRRRDCEMTETDSEVDCREDCVYFGLLQEINCTLPWMERFRRYPKLVEMYTSLPNCTDLDDERFLNTVQIQEAFMDNTKIADKKNVQECLQNCKESCKSNMVRILLLGSKSIGSNYGVTLTVSPVFDVVKEHFNYNFANMVSELCASISFLLGLSAIAIYDWLVALGVWAAIKLGLHEPEEGEGTSLAAQAGSAWPTLGSPTSPPRGPSSAEPRGRAGEPAAEDPGEEGAAGLEGKGSGSRAVGKRRVSIQLPDVSHPVDSAD